MGKNEARVIVVNAIELRYFLSYKKVKNINLRVKGDGTVLVSAGEKVSIAKIEAFIISRWDNIQGHLKRFEQIREEALGINNTLGADEFYLLGKIVKLNVSESKKEEIYTDGEYIYLKMDNVEDEERKKKIVRYFLERFTEDYLEKVVDVMYSRFGRYNIPYPKLKFRNMKSRWGSCMPYKSQVNLNKKLIQVPSECIEYVILHELAHFVHLNHSKEFYGVVSALMPDYLERKKKLSGFGAVVL